MFEYSRSEAKKQSKGGNNLDGKRCSHLADRKRCVIKAKHNKAVEEERKR